MGEAKRRGTFEERKKQSQEKYAQYLKDNPTIKHPTSSGKMNPMIAAAIGMSAMSGLDMSAMDDIIPRTPKSKIRKNKSVDFSIKNLKANNND